MAPISLTSPQVKFVPGTASQSSQLNELTDGLSRDLAILHQTARQLQSDLDRALTASQVQIEVLQEQIMGVSPAGWTVNFHGRASLEPENTAQIDPFYGQATLPILAYMGQTQLWHQGQVRVPDSVNVTYRLAESDPYQTDPTARACLTGQSWDCWVHKLEPVTGEQQVWVRLELARTVISPINCIEFVPFPIGGLTLVGASYSGAGGQEIELPLDYLTGYEPGSGTVPQVGPCRWLIEPRPVRTVTWHLTGQARAGQFWFGARFVRAGRIVFGSQAQLVCNVTGSQPVTSCQVYGRYSGPIQLNQPRTGRVQLVLAPMAELPSPIIQGLQAS
jgi:hypothetical protein